MWPGAQQCQQQIVQSSSRLAQTYLGHVRECNIEERLGADAELQRFAVYLCIAPVPAAGCQRLLLWFRMVTHIKLVICMIRSKFPLSSSPPASAGRILFQSIAVGTASACCMAPACNAAGDSAC